MRPRWMERLSRSSAGWRASSEASRAGLPGAAEECGDDRPRFSRAGGGRASWRFDDLNELIRTHNEWYPVERDLPMDLRTRDYVLINGRSYRRPELGPAWVLEHFPAR